MTAVTKKKKNVETFLKNVVAHYADKNIVWYSIEILIFFTGSDKQLSLYKAVHQTRSTLIRPSIHLFKF